MSVESELFRSLVPSRARAGMLHAIFDGCRAGWEMAGDFPRERLLDVLPYVRRVEVERRLAEVSFGDGFAPQLRQAPSMNCLEICNKRLVITAVSRSNWVTWVQPQPRRKTLARESQLSLFGDNKHDLGLRLHALLVYGTSGLGPVADQARVVFPTELGHFAPGEIDLIAEHPEVVATYLPAAETEIAPEVRLKPTARRVADDEGPKAEK